MPLSAGTKLGPYEILAPLGAGGMGEVYRARDPRLGREVAIKLLPERGDRARFRSEARALAALNQPGIVAIYDVGDDYLVTELIDGWELKTSSPRQAVEFAAQIAEALAAAHSIGITHRDLKPANILITKDGRTKLIDFGLVKQAETKQGGDAATQTLDGVVMGTVAYMSPEQVRGEKLDPRSDLFSLGVVLYEQLAGKRPFPGETAPHTMAAILDKDPEELPDSVSPALKQIVARCLAKNREQRFQTANDLAFALRTISTGASSKIAPPLKKRNWIPIAALGGLVLGGVAAFFAADRGGADVRLRVTPLSQEAGPEYTPLFSPDGKAIVFQHRIGGGHYLFLRPFESDSAVELASGLKLELGPNGQVFWSPDGTRIYFDKNHALWQVGVAGGTPTKVLDNINAAAAMPDGKALLVLRQDQLFLSEPPGAEPKPVEGLGRLRGSPFSLHISPDGRKVAFPASLGLWVMDYPSGAMKLIEITGMRTPHWFRDNRHLLVGSLVDREIMWIDSETGARKSVYTTGETVNAASLNSDATKIAFSGGNLGQDIFEYSMDGKRIRPLAATAAGEFIADWSSDGRLLVYMRRIGGSNCLMVKDIASGVTKEILRMDGTGRLVFPRISPDGRRVAFVDRGILWTVPIQGGLRQKIGGVGWYRSEWSPDGAWIAGTADGRIHKLPAQRSKLVPSRTPPSTAWIAARSGFATESILRTGAACVSSQPA